MTPCPEIVSLEPRKMHNLRMPVQLVATLRAAADQMPGWSVTDLILVGTLSLASNFRRPAAIKAISMLTPAAVMRALTDNASENEREVLRAYAQALIDAHLQKPSAPASARGRQSSRRPGRGSRRPPRSPSASPRKRSSAAPSRRGASTPKK